PSVLLATLLLLSSSRSTYRSASGRRGRRAAICPAPYQSRTTPASGATRRATVTSRTLAFLPNIILGIAQRSDQTAGIAITVGFDGRSRARGPCRRGRGTDQNLT